MEFSNWPIRPRVTMQAPPVKVKRRPASIAVGCCPSHRTPGAPRAGVTWLAVVPSARNFLRAYWAIASVRGHRDQRSTKMACWRVTYHDSQKLCGSSCQVRFYAAVDIAEPPCRCLVAAGKIASHRLGKPLALSAFPCVLVQMRGLPLIGVLSWIGTPTWRKKTVA
jgi:hypothetical protein